MYYGFGEMTRLARCARVVLQPGHHTRRDLTTLASEGTEALAYLSLSEDTGPEAPWHRAEKNEHWGGRLVDLAHEGWTRRIVERAEAALEEGFAGLFLDTLDVPEHVEDARGALLELVGLMRSATESRYLLANRGFALLPDLGELVDGLLFEAFSTTWEAGYRPLASLELLANVERLHLCRATRCGIYALDYAITPSVAAFARTRAATHGLATQISNRELTWLE